GSEQHFARPRMPFFRQSNMANAFVVSRSDIVEVPEPLLHREPPNNLHVAVGHAVGREDVVIGDDDYFVRVPDLGVGAEVFLENANRPRATNVVGHEDIDIDPHIIAWLNRVAPRVASENLLGQRHLAHGKSSHSSTSPKLAIIEHIRSWQITKAKRASWPSRELAVS